MTVAFTAADVAAFEHTVWTRCAPRYADGFGPLTTQAIPSLLESIRLTAGARVLDVGTGPGHVAAAIVDRGAVPIGIDFSDAMLQEARRRQLTVEFRQSSAEALPFGNEEFDAVVGNFVLHHSGEPALLLKEALRVLRNGGRMAFTVWGERGRASFRRSGGHRKGHSSGVKRVCVSWRRCGLMPLALISVVP